MATDNGNGRLTGKHAFIIAILGAVFGGTGGPWLLVKLGGVTPFQTDSHASKELERRVDTLERRVENHYNQVGRFESRLSGIEAQLPLILSNQARILDRLDQTH